MPPWQGGEMIREVDFAGTTYNDLPFKFEAGNSQYSWRDRSRRSRSILKETDVSRSPLKYTLRLAEEACNRSKDLRFTVDPKTRRACYLFSLMAVMPTIWCLTRQNGYSNKNRTSLLSTPYEVLRCRRNVPCFFCSV